MVFSFPGFGGCAIPNIPKAFPWLNFLPRKFTPLYGLYPKIQRLHRTIANVRNDFLHKTTTIISKNHALVVIEDLKVRNMSRSASGTFELPGKNVRARSGLNKSILDQGCSGFDGSLSTS